MPGLVFVTRASKPPPFVLLALASVAIVNAAACKRLRESDDPTASSAGAGARGSTGVGGDAAGGAGSGGEATAGTGGAPPPPPVSWSPRDSGTTVDLHAVWVEAERVIAV